MLWTFPTGSAFPSAPAVAGGVVYIGSNNGNVYALNAATGTRLWTFLTGSDISASSPAVANGVIYIGNGGLDAQARPAQNSLHPDYHLTQQR